MCRNTVTIPMAKRKMTRGIIFSEAWVKFDITRAYLKS